MRSGNEWKMALAFVVGAVVSFLVGLYVLGPLFAGKRVPQPAPADEAVVGKLADAAPAGIVRRDVDSVPEHTTVVVEPVARPVETLPPPPEERGTEPPAPPPSVGHREEPPSPPSEPHSPSPSTPSPPPSLPPQPPTPTEPPTAGERRYRVQAGVFEKPENADRLMAELAKQGYHPFKQEETLPSGVTRYRVFVGAFDDRESAERLKKELNDKGFAAAVVEEGTTGR